MIRVRDEMKGAVRKYAEAITKTPVVHHQVSCTSNFFNAMLFSHTY